jgi:phospholipid/cholesterol/gamma-HCH transport system substrate-binding protein
MRRAIVKHRADFIAILVLFVLAVGVGGYILSQERFYLPEWVPIFGTDFVTYKAQFTTAQSVTPGQGQTVDIAGVPVGEISNVELVDGRAVVTMKIRHKYAKVHRDAFALLRPKTGLNDMIIALNPGTRGTPMLKHDGVIPISDTLPNVNPDEVLSALDADTRDYLKLLLNAGGQGLRGEGRNLSAVFRRFDPTARDLRKVTAMVAQRQRNLARVVHNFAALSAALGAKDDQITQFVDSSNAVFRSFANQQDNVRQTIALLPGALSATRGALVRTDALARQLGPALQALRPGARALGPTLRQVRPFVTGTVAPIRDQIRPFTRAALPTVRALRPTAHDLTKVTPNLTQTFKELNALVNILAYNPPGPTEEGYLFWAAWANHNADSLISAQDALGPIRRLEFLVSCSSLAILKTLSDPAVNPVLATLTQLLDAPLNSPACPQSSQPGSGIAPTAGAGGGG